MQYAECLKKYYNAVDGTFYAAIKEGGQNMSEERMCTIDVMGYDYEVKVLINNIDIGLKGGKS